MEMCGFFNFFSSFHFFQAGHYEQCPGKFAHYSKMSPTRMLFSCLQFDGEFCDDGGVCSRDSFSY